jgi:hypothetical protein
MTHKHTQESWVVWTLSPESDLDQRHIITTTDGEIEITGIVHNPRHAPLIATAPELAKALRQLYEPADRYIADKAGREAIAYAGEILAKAEV